MYLSNRINFNIVKGLAIVIFLVDNVLSTNVLYYTIRFNSYLLPKPTSLDCLNVTVCCYKQPHVMFQAPLLSTDYKNLYQNHVTNHTNHK